MMKNIALTFSLFLLPLISLAQDKYSVELNSDIGLYNTALDAQTLLNSFDYIDDDQKQAILRNMDDENYFYVDINNVIKFSVEVDAFDNKRYKLIWVLEKAKINDKCVNCWMTTSVTQPQYIGQLN